MSSYSLTNDQLRLLNLGLSFIPKPLKPNRVTLIQQVKDFTRKMRLRYCYRDTLRQKPALSRRSGYDPGPTDNLCLEAILIELEQRLIGINIDANQQRRNNFDARLRLALKQLVENKNIHINKADKGSTIVIENLRDYVVNGREHLKDDTVYSRLSEDITPSLKKAITEKLWKLKAYTLLNREQLQFCFPPAHHRLSRLYFLKKVHKSPYGIRPIVSSCSSITENISEFVDHCLQPLVSSIPSYIRDSQHFLEKIGHLTVPEGAFLASLDVVSLYTNIPHEDGLRALHNSLIQRGRPNTSIPYPEVIVELTSIVLKNNVFEFAGEFYLQVNGTAMGTKLAPAYANIFMAYIEKEMQALVDPDTIILWCRFIDDIFVIWNDTKEAFVQFVEKCNKLHKTIKMTHQISELEMTFLDITIYKGAQFYKNGHLDYRTYLKPTNALQYVHADSYHSPGTHKGIILGGIHRYLRTNSDKSNFDKLLHLHKSALVKRGYNKHLIDDILRDFLEKKVSDQYPHHQLYIPDCIFNENIPHKQTGIDKQNDPPCDEISSLNVESSYVNPAEQCEEINPAIQTQYKEQTPVLVLLYNDHINKFREVINDVWSKLDQDEDLHRLYPNKPYFAFTNNASLRDVLVHSRVNWLPRPIRNESQVNSPGTNEIRSDPLYPLCLIDRTSHTTVCRDNCKVCNKLVIKNQIFNSRSRGQYFVYVKQQTISCQTLRAIFSLHCKECNHHAVISSRFTIREEVNKQIALFRRRKSNLLLCKHLTLYRGLPDTSDLLLLDVEEKDEGVQVFEQLWRHRLVVN